MCNVMKAEIFSKLSIGRLHEKILLHVALMVGPRNNCAQKAIIELYRFETYI